MKENRCPLLEITKVGFCRGFPVKKMIPINQILYGESVCNTPQFEGCVVYRERGHSRYETEEIRGSRIKLDYYYHPGHTWIALSEGNLAKVGIDDFSQKLIGRIESVTVPPPGTTLQERSVCILINSGKKMVHFGSPTDGVVESINPVVSANPSIVNVDPYFNGWILTMRISEDGLGGLFYGSTTKRWIANEVERLLKFFKEAGITVTDGGELISDLFSKLHEDQWRLVIRLFLG